MLIAAVVVVSLIMARKLSTPHNVLLITMDTTRADRLGCYGYANAATPSVDMLARKGVRFENAFAAAPLTLPSHATIFTGLYPPEHGLRLNGQYALDESIPTLAGILSEQGFRTAAFVAAFVLDSKFGLNHGFEVYSQDLTGTARPTINLDRYRPGNRVADDALSWLVKHHHERFFCWVHFFDPHDPYNAHEDLFGNAFAHPYDAEIAFMDRQIGRLLNFLKEQGLEKNTLVIAVGDHGEGLGEHGEETHGIMAYNTTMHVPLIFSCPKQIKQGTRISATVSLVDLVPTILEFLRLDADIIGHGRSLLPGLKGRHMDSATVYGETLVPYSDYGWAPIKTITSPEWKYIHTSRSELYRIDKDPHETSNVAADLPEKVRELSDFLSSMEKAMTGRAATPVSLTSYQKSVLKSLGYIGGGRSDSDEIDIAALQDVKDMLPFCTYLRSRMLTGNLRGPELVQHYLELIRLSPETPLFHDELGNILMNLQKFDEALTHFEKAIQLRPDNAGLYCNAGTALARQDRLNEAISRFNKALRLDPLFAEAHNNLAAALYDSGKFDDAVKHFKESLRLDPDNADMHYNLARALAELDKPDEAMKHYIETIRFDPDNSNAHNNLGIILFNKGQLEKATVSFAEAIRLDPMSAGAYYNLGQAMIRQGKPDGGIQAMVKAVNLARTVGNEQLAREIEAQLEGLRQ